MVASACGVKHDSKGQLPSKPMKISVIIPARNEESFIGGCLESVLIAAENFAGDVEVIVCLNRCTDKTEEIARSYGAAVVSEEGKNMARIRNRGAEAATGDVIVTIDADSRMSTNMLREIAQKLSTGKYIGGGVMMLPERVSLGILATIVAMVPLIVIHRVSGGLFWCLREDFEALRGFNESWVSVEDVDFAKRLKAHGKRVGKRFKTIIRANIVTSCRKFDKFGDWYLIRNPSFVRRIFSGKDQKAADTYYYDVER
jgi:glycosyltransferase involved in cell wall biosynthesis